MNAQAFLDAVVVDFLPPLAPHLRSTYTITRLAVLKDNMTIPVLRLLALQKFGEWPPDQFPFWVDGDWTNETFENVELATRRKRVVRRLHLSGPDYRKQWRAANPDRVMLYNARARRRAHLRRFLEGR